MSEIKVTKPGERTKLDESTTRLQDVERRLHTVQNHLAQLSNLAGMMQTPPLPAPTPPTLPQPGYSFYSAGAGGANPSYPMGTFASAQPLRTSGLGNGSPLALYALQGYPSVGLTSTALETALSTRDFEKLPAVHRAPECNLVDAGDNFVLQFELPGVRKDDLEITASEHNVTVRAEARVDAGDGTVLLGEVIPVEYRRTVPLPSACNVAQSKAALKDGFLTLRVPKKEPTESPRRLDVAYG